MARYEGWRVLSFIKPVLCPVLITNRQSTSIVNNIVAIKLLSAPPPVNIVTVYRALWASTSDTKAFFAELDKIFSTATNGALAGDFNMPQIDHCLSSKGRFDCSTLCHLQALIDYHILIFINKELTKSNAILYFVIVTSSLSQEQCAAVTTHRWFESFGSND